MVKLGFIALLINFEVGGNNPELDKVNSILQTEKSKIFNILIGCTGSVASIKVPILAERFALLGHNIRIVPTRNAMHFLKADAVTNCKVYLAMKENCSHYRRFERWKSISSTEDTNEDVFESCIECEIKALYPEFTFATDAEEWELWHKRGDDVLHIELRDWADILLIAPLDANTLAKIAQGLCDNLLTCVVRAWNMKKPILFCPAMNTQMYVHPFTSQHINILKDLGYQEIEATTKTLMCGETGVGAMAEVDVIVDAVKENLKKLAT